MKKTAKEKIMREVIAHGFGWAFCAKDFMPGLKRSDVDTALFHLERERKIRKVMRGIYDYPVFSSVLQKKAAPDFDQVASAITRKLNREMQVTGNAALNYLKISTQIPAKCVYLWNSRSQDFCIGNGVIHFKSAPKKDFSPKLFQSRLIVQALRQLEGSEITPEMRETLKNSFTQSEWRKIQEDTAFVSNHIYKQLCELAK